MTTPANIVEAQLRAYNARDLDAWLATYAPDAEQFALNGDLLARGHAAMRARSAPRFAEPDLHALLLHRTVMAQAGKGHVVVDHERVTRNFAEGRGTVEMLCIYEVHGGLIRRASFALGPTVMEPQP